VNALANPKVGEYVNKYFVSSFQKVATFRIVGKNKQGGNVATYFCAPDGRILHVVAGPVDADTMLREAKWVVETAEKAIDASKGDGAKFKVIMRTAHADRLRKEHGLVTEPVLFDPPAAQSENDTLTYKDPTGRPLAPMLKPPPIDGPDVKFRDLVEASAKSAQLAPTANGLGLVRDKKGGGWALGNQGRVHLLMSAHSMNKIETVYASVFEGILGERVSTRPIEIVHPFPWNDRPNPNPNPNPKLRLGGGLEK
jgi:hypothetical protein